MNAPTLDDVRAALNGLHEQRSKIGEFMHIEIVSAKVGGDGDTPAVDVPGMVVVKHPLWGISVDSATALRALKSCRSVEGLFGMLEGPGMVWLTDEGKKSAPGTTYYI